MVDLPHVLFAIAGLLVVISAVQPIARRLMLADTVVLAVVGVLIGIGATALLETTLTDRFDGIAWALLHFPVDSEVFLLVFLPVLVFGESLSVDVRQLAHDAAPVLMLAIVAVLLTTAAIGFALPPIAHVSLTVSLMVGAIVATTDPSAVLSVFRDIGVSGRLTRLVAGESLLNDAAAIAIFSVLLDALIWHQHTTPLALLMLLAQSFAGGMVVGVVLARLVLAAVPLLGEIAAGEVTITLALPYIAYLLSDRFLGFSGVVAAAAAGLTIRAYGASTFRPRNWAFLLGVWGQLNFWAGSMVFVLASMLVPRLLIGFSWKDAELIGVTVLAATAARGVVLFALMPMLEATRLANRVSTAIRLTMLWGGLRGAITLAMALAVTEHRLIPDATKHFIAVLATGFVLVTLLVNGTTLRFVVRALKLDRLPPIDEALRHQVLAIAFDEVRDQLGEAADEFGLPQHAVGSVQRVYVSRAEAETAANSFDAAISDRDRIKLALITFASRERSILLDMFQVRGLPRGTMEMLLRTTDAMLDGARNEGRYGYMRAARRRLRPGPGFRLAQWLHRHFHIDGPLTRRMMERFETLLILHLVTLALDRFMRRRMEPVLGARVAAIVDEILARRRTLLQDAIDTLRVQYHGYAESLETRLTHQFGLQLERREYRQLLEENLISDELHGRLSQALERQRGRTARRLRFHLQTGLSNRVRQIALFAGLPEAVLHDISMSLTMRFTVPGEVLARAGRRTRSVCFISSGAVELRIGTEDVRLAPGDCFGLPECLEGGRNPGTVRSVSFCHLLELSRAEMQRLVADNPELAPRVRALVAAQEQRAHGEPEEAPAGPAAPRLLVDESADVPAMQDLATLERNNQSG
ncbi:MAG TPA: cation:proton antiporter [Acetobacteraceae bacterium]|nr:cation:proton antiporter [Acetobacteraceae bacterium]